METPKRVLRNSYLQNIQKVSSTLKIPASPMMKSLGFGTGVSVYRLDRSPKQGQVLSPWAIKKVAQRFKEDDRKDIFNERIQEEAKILRKLSHPNIVGFRGITKNADGLDTLVLECCKTSLGSILEERREDDLGALPPKETLKMIVDIAHALDYLHTQAKLLHGDLKSYNVLVKGDFEICKLCDFGVSIPLDENGTVNFEKNPKLRYVGTNLWSAPEVMDEDSIIDTKADIFSFGLVIYETIALVPPHTLELSVLERTDVENTTDSECEKPEESIEIDDFAEMIDGAYGTRPPLPQAFDLVEDYSLVVELFYCCTNACPENRPSANTIWKTIEKPETDDGK